MSFGRFSQLHFPGLQFNRKLLISSTLFLLLREIFVLGLLSFLRFPSSCTLDILQVTFFNLLAPIFALEALLKCLVIPTFKCPIGNFMYLGGSCLLWALSRVVWLTSSLGESLGQYFSFWSHSGEKVSSADVLGLGWGCGWLRSQRLAWRLSFKLTVGCELTAFSCACIPHRRGLFFFFFLNPFWKCCNFLLGLETHLCWAAESMR